MVLGEQAPKIWAIQTAERSSLTLSAPLYAFTFVLRPLIHVVNAMSNGLLRTIGIKGGHAEHDHDVVELKGIIGAAASAGNISARQRVFAENILDLVGLEVRHVMLPRPEVAYLDVSAPIEQSLARIRSAGHSRWPLCRGGLDEVIGVVLVRDLLDVLLAKRTVDLQAIARAPLYVPDTQPLPRFILESQQTGHHAALVLDEHGTMVGMAFLEDALEEIVGPLPDEHDRRVEEEAEREEGALEMDGSLALPEAGDLLGIPLDEGHDTIGGLLIAHLGRLPRKGDKVHLDGYLAEILLVGKRRSIARVRFTKSSGAQADASRAFGEDPADDDDESASG